MFEDNSKIDPPTLNENTIINVNFSTSFSKLGVSLNIYILTNELKII